MLVEMFFVNTDCLFTVMVYKISEKFIVIQVPQQMPSVGDEGCVVSTAGCRWCLEKVPLRNGGRLYCSRPYLDMFLHSDCSELTDVVVMCLPIVLFFLEYSMFCPSTN